jgi:hypothetical protein
MKMNSKKILTIVLGLAIATNLFLPVASFAQTTTVANRFCTNIDKILSPIDQRIADREGKLQAKRQEISDNLAKRINERDAKKLENRNVRDDNRDAQYAKLEAKATTDAQKQAVASFKTTVESAVSARKATVDSAIQALRQSVDQSITARKSAVDAAINAFKNSRTAAMEKAKADCVAGVDAKTVRETYRTSMKAAQDKFKSDFQAIEKLKGSFETVRAERKQAVEKAIADFKVVMEKARADLKTAFQQ